MTNETMEPDRGPGVGMDWNTQAEFYDKFVFCELEDTEAYLDAIGIGPDDTVLDVCCGPGRISVLAAQRCKSVTGFDSAEKMLDAARVNARERGLENVELRLLDWNHVLPGQNVAKHDVVIASRNHAMGDVKKLSALANKKVALQIFADAPSIPGLIDVLFSGCGEESGHAGHPGSGAPGMSAPGAPGMPGSGAPGMPMGGPGGHPGHGGPGGSGCRPSYMNLVNKAHEAGYLPNVRIMPERFRKTFATKTEAINFVCSIKPERAAGHEERVALNVEPFLTKTDAGVEFCIATRAAIIWWEV